MTSAVEPAWAKDDEPRTVSRLGEGERDAIWQYDDPLWPAHYAWHPDHGWLYSTESNRSWRASVSGSESVTSEMITHSRTEHRNFIEIARYRDGYSVIFTPRGPICAPGRVDSNWPSVCGHGALVNPDE